MKYSRNVLFIVVVFFYIASYTVEYVLRSYNELQDVQQVASIIGAIFSFMFLILLLQEVSSNKHLYAKHTKNINPYSLVLFSYIASLLCLAFISNSFFQESYRLILFFGLAIIITIPFFYIYSSRTNKVKRIAPKKR